MKYYVIKSTKTAEGDLRPIAVNTYNDKDLADQAFFTACAEAVTTGLGMYAVTELTEELGAVADRHFIKNNLQPEEPEE